MYKYNIQFIAGVENNHSYFPYLILLIKKHLAKCITKNISIEDRFCWLLKVTYTMLLIANFRTIFMLSVLVME